MFSEPIIASWAPCHCEPESLDFYSIRVHDCLHVKTPFSAGEDTLADVSDVRFPAIYSKGLAFGSLATKQESLGVRTVAADFE